MSKQTRECKVDEFTRAYMECALWSSIDDDGEPLDRDHGIEDVSTETWKNMVDDCTAFQRDNEELLTRAFGLYAHSPEWSHDAQAGHDFWLTRNGHGAGFWDRGLGDVGRKLTDKAHEYGEFNLYVGDDGQIYGM